MSRESEARIEQAGELVRKILRHHPRLSDRQLAWVGNTFRVSRHYVLEARRQLARKGLIRCLAQLNPRGQLVKVWELVR